MMESVAFAITCEAMLRSTPNCAPNIGRMKRRPIRISIPYGSSRARGEARTFGSTPTDALGALMVGFLAAAQGIAEDAVLREDRMLEAFQLGLLAEMVIRVYFESQQKPIYVIRETVEAEQIAQEAAETA